MAPSWSKLLEKSPNFTAKNCLLALSLVTSTAATVKAITWGRGNSKRY